jgi:hypothetical protein
MLSSIKIFGPNPLSEEAEDPISSLVYGKDELYELFASEQKFLDSCNAMVEGWLKSLDKILAKFRK